MPGSKKPLNVNRISNERSESLKFNCKFCDYNYERQREKCPAWGNTRGNCKGLNHFNSKWKKVHAASQSQDGDSSNEYNDQWLMAVNHGKESITASLTEHDIRFQLDSAADVNTLCQKHERKH